MVFLIDLPSILKEYIPVDYKYSYVYIKICDVDTFSNMRFEYMFIYISESEWVRIIREEKLKLLGL